MKKFSSLILLFVFVLALQSCRETVPPETLEDPETSTEESSEVDMGDYEDES